MPIPHCADISWQMRNEVVQILLENNDVASFGENDTLALNLFLQRENAYDHIRTLSFPMICVHRLDDPNDHTASSYGMSRNDTQSISMCSKLRELRLNLAYSFVSYEGGVHPIS